MDIWIAFGFLLGLWVITFARLMLLEFRVRAMANVLEGIRVSIKNMIDMLEARQIMMRKLTLSGDDDAEVYRRGASERKE